MKIVICTYSSCDEATGDGHHVAVGHIGGDVKPGKVVAALEVNR